VAESPGPAGGRRGNADGGARNAGQLVDTLKSELTLSAAQIAEIEAAVADMRKSVAGGNGQDAAGRREQFRAARQELEQRIDSALTPEQRSRYAEIRQRATETSGGRATQTGRVFVVGPDGRPLGVTLRLGASDGGVTEVVAGLEADREVIVGGGPRTAEAPRGARFGF
jgi:hypothetical protein